MKKPLNVLISSTQQWNPGDEFIRMGVQNLLTKLLPANTNWLLWNRNPDLFINRWENAHQHPERLTNSLREPCLDVIDLVIFAGTPEWTGQSVRRIYEELLRYPHVPVLMLGVGSGAANIDLSPIEIEVISRDNVTIITRAAELANAINALIEKPKAIAMPCPALFCNATETFPGNNNKIGFILQSSSVINQSISETSVQTILQFLGNYAEKSVDVVCFYIDEFMRFIRSLSNKSVIYDLNAAVYLKRLQQYSVVLSTRLHGAIASLSCGVPTILVCDDNYRIQSTAELFGGILPVWQSKHLSTKAIQQFEQEKITPEAIFNFKNETMQGYLSTLKPFLNQHLLKDKL